METANSTTTKTFYVTDHLGSTVMETDTTGKVVWSTDYSAFGETAHETGLEEEGGKFTGKEIDPETNLYYFNQRWYCAETGRFVTEDPARDGPNWYAYCGNNPVNFTDPTGLEWRLSPGGGFYEFNANLYGTTGHRHPGTDWIYVENGINIPPPVVGVCGGPIGAFFT